MKIRLATRLIAVDAPMITAALHASDLNTIRSNLDARVGGEWRITTNQMWTFVAPAILPKDLDKGTYCVFVSDSNRPAIAHAITWMEICQAPFFILGTNAECVVVTYIPRQHPVSQGIIRALELGEPTNTSPAEAMTLRKPEQKEGAKPSH